MKNYIVLGYLCIIALLISCSSDGELGEWKSSVTGAKYQFHKRGKGDSPSRGDVLILEQQITTNRGVVIQDTRKTNVPYGHILNNKGPLAKKVDPILLEASQGDSLTILLDVVTMFGHKFIPPGVSPKDTIIWKIFVADVQDYQAFQETKKSFVKRAAEGRKKKNDQILKGYIKAENLKAKKTKNGVYYAIKKTGYGPKPSNQDEVSFHYDVFLLTGKKADSSYERGEPFKFVMGRGAAISGIEEALRHMHEGTTATILIPSEMAYGADAKGTQIPPYSNLRFEIELVKVVKD